MTLPWNSRSNLIMILLVIFQLCLICDSVKLPRHCLLSWRAVLTVKWLIVSSSRWTNQHSWCVYTCLDASSHYYHPVVVGRVLPTVWWRFEHWGWTVSGLLGGREKPQSCGPQHLHPCQAGYLLVACVSTLVRAWNIKWDKCQHKIKFVLTFTKMFGHQKTPLFHVFILFVLTLHVFVGNVCCVVTTFISLAFPAQ